MSLRMVVDIFVFDNWKHFNILLSANNIKSDTSPSTSDFLMSHNLSLYYCVISSRILIKDA